MPPRRDTLVESVYRLKPQRTETMKILSLSKRSHLK